jgi:small ligand-binding sensory domain FIST
MVEQELTLVILLAGQLSGVGLLVVVLEQLQYPLLVACVCGAVLVEAEEHLYLLLM